MSLMKSVDVIGLTPSSLHPMSLFPVLLHSTRTSPSTPPSKNASTASSSAPPRSPTPPRVNTNATALLLQNASTRAESGENDRWVISGGGVGVGVASAVGRRLREDEVSVSEGEGE